tara:strand:+ start:148 stop:480 length:333 start_codon:yes stop_codon:yes gene_type:complete
MEEIYVADPLADKLIAEYPDYYFEDVGTGVIFSVPENKAGNKFIRLVNKLSNSAKWKNKKPFIKKPNLVGTVFERTGICPTCGISIEQFEKNGCGIAHFPIKLCPGTYID